jgi:hypothetical protein
MTNPAKTEALPKTLPSFSDEADERTFWESKDTDVTVYFDTTKLVKFGFKNLQPSARRTSNISDSAPPQNWQG